jgi:hypothetical protein
MFGAWATAKEAEQKRRLDKRRPDKRAMENRREVGFIVCNLSATDCERTCIRSEQRNMETRRLNSGNRSTRGYGVQKRSSREIEKEVVVEVLRRLSSVPSSDALVYWKM